MIPVTFTSLEKLQELDVDTIIDVRSPAEYDEDHLPGAINLPVLEDDQRAEVGTIYSKVSPFMARKKGGALVAQNTAIHLQRTLAGKDGAWQPLIYCWRGGQRSNAFATILDQVGWRVKLLQGGYQSYRRAIVELLYKKPILYRLILISGSTGTAKTALLHQLASKGAQTLDIEGIAAHRGSLFGSVNSKQPTQKMFESLLANKLSSLDPNAVTFMEAESSKVGELLIPPSLWSSMAVAPQIKIKASLEARSKFLCKNYSDLTENKNKLNKLIDKLRPYHCAEQINVWKEQAIVEEWQNLALGLITKHYDPRYAKSASHKNGTIHTIRLSDLNESTLSLTADTLRTEFK